jgi:DNA-binding transcriptional ArsR family regulator
MASTKKKVGTTKQKPPRTTRKATGRVTGRAPGKAPGKARPTTTAPGGRGPGWTFLTNHAHVLFCLAAEPGDVRVRDVAGRVGITERAVHRILDDLEGAGYITRSRVGRRSVYVVDDKLPLRHPIEAHRRVNDLLALVFAKPHTQRG